MKIAIHYNFTNTSDYYSYGQIEEILNKENINPPSFIQTHCLDHFNFDILLNDKIEDVIVYKMVENNSLMDIHSISLKKLLETKGRGYTHTNKEIRKEHNARKMLVAGALKWK